MKCDKKYMFLYAVTDRRWATKQSLYEQIECAIKGGITCLQLREKDLGADKFFAEAAEIKKLCNKNNIPFIINDNADIAVKCGADGLHIGQEDMAASDARKLIGDDMILGVSAQTVEQAVKAERDGADYLGVGAVFNTSTKTDAADVPLETLKEICAAVSIPVVAIGGINEENISQLKGSGIDGAALVSAIFAAKDVEKSCKTLAEKLKGVVE